jgi:PAS domain S-box-containing protein
MSDKQKTKAKLIIELEELRQQIAELEAVEEEYKQAEEALRESEEKARGIIEQSFDGIILVDMNCRVIEWNNAIVHITGISKEEAVGQYMWDIQFKLTPPDLRNSNFHGELKDGFLKAIKEEDTTWIGTLIDQNIQTVDGILKTVRTLSYMITTAEGNMICTIMRDVTERKRAEEERKRLLASESQQRIISETLAEVTLALTSKTDISSVLEEILIQIRRIVPYETANIALLDGHFLRAGAWYGYKDKGSEDFISSFTLDLNDSPMDAVVIKSKLPKAISDVSQEPGWIVFEETNWIKSYLGIPICHQDKVLGVIRLDGVEVDRFSQEDAERLLPLASSAAVALENASLYEQAQHEITERKQAEEALKESEEKFSKAFQSNAVLMAISSIEEGTFLEINDIFCQKLGYERHEVLGKTSKELTLFPDYRQREEVAQIVREKGYARNCEVLIQTKNGNLLYGLFSADIIYLKEKPYLLTVMNDITEQKRAEEALKESELNYRTVADLTYAWEFWVNPDGSMQYVSPSCERITGYTAEDMIENPDLRKEIMTEETRVDWEEHKRIALEELGVHEVTFAIKRKDGETRWIEHLCQPVTDEDGTYLGIRASNRDITERKQAEEEIRKLNEELEQRVIDRTTRLKATNEELEAFSYSISHDMRAPLRAINGFSALLKDEYGELLDEKGNRYLDTLQSSTLRMDRLINDLLSLSRLGRRDISLQPINITAMVKKVFSDQIKDEVDRVFDLQVADCPIVEADSRLVEILVTNLLSNAIKFTRGRDPAVIEFGRLEKDDESIYFVKDNGIGFDMDYAEKLFNPFQRLHTEREFEGTGIGLAIVRRIVRRHGGRVWVEAELDKGATFFFTLEDNKINI